MQNINYDSILRMILQYNKSSTEDQVLGSSLGSTYGSSTAIDDPKSIVNLDNYDYALLYNDDEDLIGFTSNDGTWNWELKRDSFDDLVKVDVTNPLINFTIGLIYENYDFRTATKETDDKGKLMDVILKKAGKTVSFTKTQDYIWKKNLDGDVQVYVSGNTISKLGLSLSDTYSYNDGEFQGIIGVSSLTELQLNWLSDADYITALDGDYHGTVRVTEIFTGIANP